MPNDSTSPHPLANLVGEIIVVDAASPYVYVGRLQSQTSVSIELSEADCHDLRDSLTSREKYVMDCRVHGVSPNRQRAWVRMDEIVGWCRLEDIIVE